jgi:predicted Zn-dependent protease
MRGSNPFWRGLWERERTRTAAFYAVLVGGLAAMAFEDTGIAMLAIMVLVSVLAVIYYESDARTRSSGRGEDPVPTPGG